MCDDDRKKRKEMQGLTAVRYVAGECDTNRVLNEYGEMVVIQQKMHRTLRYQEMAKQHKTARGVN